MNKALKQKLETVSRGEVVAVINEQIAVLQSSYQVNGVVTDAETLHSLACLRKALIIVRRAKNEEYKT
jgi:hypothetical protein